MQGTIFFVKFFKSFNNIMCTFWTVCYITGSVLKETINCMWNSNNDKEQN